MCLEATLLWDKSLSHIVTIPTSWGSSLSLSPSISLWAATWERLRKFGETLSHWAPWFMCGTSAGSVQWLDTSIYMLSFFLAQVMPLTSVCHSLPSTSLSLSLSLPTSMLIALLYTQKSHLFYFDFDFNFVHAQHLLPSLPCTIPQAIIIISFWGYHGDIEN